MDTPTKSCSPAELRLRRDVADDEAVRGAGKAAVGDQGALLAQPDTHQRGGHGADRSCVGQQRMQHHHDVMTCEREREYEQEQEQRHRSQHLGHPRSSFWPLVADHDHVARDHFSGGDTLKRVLFAVEGHGRALEVRHFLTWG